MVKEDKEKGEKEPGKDKFGSLKRYAALSGIGIQMGVTIFLFAWAGRALDERYTTEKNWFTIGLVLLGVAVSIFFVIKQLQAVNDKFKD